ncbi:uncharacterized protein LOC126668319 [Mercurialis annua]|uniref:uncharacterized protein LOC126668319 n=1 Tax=Mercurialis annua TaxID=3986 RepID=UPI00216005A4|nr:uncharacterized protein LOC126668319 [Mercurialis annua]
MFIGGDMVEWASQMKIKMLHSTPYYAQDNGQAEATNRAIKLIVQKMIEENLWPWHVLLSEAVWANRTSQKSATGTSPYRMVYGHDEDAANGINSHVNSPPKRRVERAYNKRVKLKSFVVGDMVWKAILPIGHKDRRFGKWSPNWEGPFIVTTKLDNGAYVLADIDGDEHNKAINGQF